MADRYRIVVRFPPSFPGPHRLFVYRCAQVNQFFTELPHLTFPGDLVDMNEYHRNLTELGTGIKSDPWILSVNAASAKCTLLFSSLYVVYIPLLVTG